MKWILLILGLVLLIGTASATNYYVATWGDNTTQGNLTHPWQNVSYGSSQLTAGDTLYLIDGTWYNEHVVFSNSGNATHPITITSYNGTPTLDGVDETGYGIYVSNSDYIDITGNILIKKYYQGIYGGGSPNHININDVKLDLNYGFQIQFYIGTTYLSIDNVTVTNNSLGGTGGGIVVQGYNLPSNHITIKNSFFENNWHNAINIHSEISHVLIENNTIENATNAAGITVHNFECQNITIRNNTISNSTRGIYIVGTNDSVIESNTIINSRSSHGVLLYAEYSANGFGGIKNITIRDNIITGSATYGVRVSKDASNLEISDITFNNNSIEKKMDFNGDNTSNITVQDIADSDGSREIYIDEVVSNLEIKFTDNTIFTEDSANDVQYYTDKSNISLSGLSGTITLTKYNTTLLPTNNHLKDVVMNYESNSSDDRTNITANSSVADNPSWINATMQNASNTYNVSIDGVYITQAISDSNGNVQYQYTSSWSSHDFEFDWHSTAGLAWTPSIFGNYYNITNQIEITMGGYGDRSHLFSRTPTEADGNATGFKMVVKT